MRNLRVVPSANVFTIACSLAAAMATWGGCQWGGFLTSKPETKRMHGRWVIDAERTTWKQANKHIEAGDLDPKHGYLELEPNGRFNFENMPNFWRHPPGAAIPTTSGSGLWDLEKQEYDGCWFINLLFERVDGRRVDEECAAAWLQSEGQALLLHIMIGDPDSRQSLILKRE